MQRNEILRAYGTDYRNMTKALLNAADAAEDIKLKCGLISADAGSAASIRADGSADSEARHDKEAAAASGGTDSKAEDFCVRDCVQEPGNAGEAGGKAAPERRLRIGIKPNLVCPTPAEFGGTTHPEIVSGIIEYLFEQGFSASEIEILEGSWVGDKTEEAFEYCGYNTLSQRYGVKLVDMQKEQEAETCDCAGTKLNICTHAIKLDYLINVPVLKGHCQTRITCALKNMKGLIPNSEKRRFHSLGLHNPIAHLNTVLRPDLIVIDHICGDPDFEEGGSPLVRNCIMTAKDPVLTDAFTARVLGYEPEEIGYIALAEHLGIGSTDLTQADIRTICGDITEGEPSDDCFKQEAAGLLNTPETRKIVEISYAVDEIDSCSACYGNLIPALDRLKSEGLFEELLKVLDGSKLGIGQGYRGRSGSFGIGSCTAGFKHCIKGCPPKAEDIYTELKGML